MGKLCLVWVLVGVAASSACSGGGSVGDEGVGAHASRLDWRPGEMELVVVWDQYADVALAGTRIDASLDGQGRLALGAIAAPGEDVLESGRTQFSTHPDEQPVAYGLLLVVRPGADLADLSADDLLGGVADHALVYAPAGVREGTMAGTAFGALSAGMHVLSIERDDTERCYDAPGDDGVWTRDVECFSGVAYHEDAAALDDPLAIVDDRLSLVTW